MKVTQKIAVAYLRARFGLLSVIAPRRAAKELFTFFSTPKLRTVKELPASFQEATVLQSIFEGQQITGYRWNAGASKKCLIIHGYESAAINFEVFVSMAVAKGYEVYAFDAPAHGRSEGKLFNARDYHHFLLDIIKKHGPFDAYLAHSIGGLALSLALNDIQPGEKTKVVLIAPLTESVSSANQLFHFMRVKNRKVRHHFDQLIQSISGHSLNWFSIPRILPNLRTTILWLHDADDTITPFADVEKVDFNQYKNIRLVITKGLGHRAIYRDPEVGRTIATFL